MIFPAFWGKSSRLVPRRKKGPGLRIPAKFCGVFAVFVIFLIPAKTKFFFPRSTHTQHTELCPSFGICVLDMTAICKKIHEGEVEAEPLSCTCGVLLLRNSSFTRVWSSVFAKSSLKDYIAMSI